MSAGIDTKTKILNAAEKLFAEHGFSDTSLRAITSKAEVNLASVNYHFGSKKELIRAVLARYLDAFMPAASHALFDMQQAQQPSLHEIFAALVQPLLALDNIRDDGTRLFLQLLGRGYIESQGHLRWFITSHYQAHLQYFMQTVKTHTPEIDEADLFWRLHFSLGTVAFTMASSKALIEIAEADFNQQNDIEALIRKMLPFIAAGLIAK